MHRLWVWAANWCVPDRALHRERRPGEIEQAHRIADAIFGKPGMAVPVMKYSYSRIQVPASWVVGREG